MSERCARWRGFTASSLACWLALTLAHGARAENPPAVSGIEHQVEFHAKRVELAPQPGALVLEGDVSVRVDRFQLSSPALLLSRSSRGVHVEGSGRLSFCGCRQPLLSFGFERADLAPPTDVLLESATLRVFGLPLLWSPYLWLRSKDRAGLVPPSFGYRSREGVVVGTGAHLPAFVGGRSTLDLNLFAFTRGGGRAEAALHSANGGTLLAVDYLARTGVELRSQQAIATSDGHWAAERVDAMRGQRAVEASLDLERAALGVDRLRAGLVRADGVLFGLGFAADAARGAGLADYGSFGPTLVLARSGAASRSASYDVQLVGHSAYSRAGALFVGEMRGGSESSLWFGPVAATLASHQRLVLAVEPSGASDELASELRARMAVPLFKRFAKATHTIEPAIESVLWASESHGSAGDALLPLPSSRHWLAFASIDNGFGFERAQALETSLAAGAAGDQRSTRAVLAARVKLDVAFSRLRLDLRAVPQSSALDASARWSAPLPYSVRLGLGLDARRRNAEAARGLWREDFASPRLWFDRTGVGANALLAVPLGFGVAVSGAVAVDWSSRELLAALGRIGYRHPCRCISLGLWGMHRVGRPGVDTGIELAVFPR